MELLTFLKRLVDDGVEAARRDYADDPGKLAGAVSGFEACRAKTPEQLAAMLVEARRETATAYREKAADYWYWRCRDLEVEWVCNVLSAALLNEGQPTIVQPTYRGVMKAAEILGVAAA